MTDQTTPTNLDWVTERSKCSLFAVFKQLQAEVQEDIQKMQAILGANSNRLSFVRASDRNFSVNRTDKDVFPTPIERSVDFALEQSEIIVVNIDNEIAARATITLNDEGRCMLKVNDRELEHWQFRRMALERIFFGSLGKP